MHLAVVNGNSLVVEALLKAGADVHAAEELTGITSLHLSVSDSEDISVRARERCCRLLLTYGADPNAKDARGRTCIALALASDMGKMISELRAAAGRRVGAG